MAEKAAFTGEYQELKFLIAKRLSTLSTLILISAFIINRHRYGELQIIKLPYF